MVTYEITAQVAPDLVEAYEQYMQEQHIPALLETGCFVEAVFARAETGHYRIWYAAPEQAVLDTYISRHAGRLRADLGAHFPQGVTLTREIWETVGSWRVAGAAGVR